MDKFGRVFVSRQCQDESITSACFSNLDWKWYSPVGGIHKDFYTYGNMPVSIGLGLEVNNKSGDSEKFNVKIKLPFVLKDLPVGPSKEYLIHAKKHEMEVAKKFDILDLENTEQLENFSRWSGFTAFICPNDELNRSSDLLIYIRILTIVDDLLDDDDDDDDYDGNPVSRLFKTLKYSGLAAYFEEAAAEIRGESKSYGEKLKSDMSGIHQTIGFGFHDAMTVKKFHTAFLNLSKEIRKECLRLSKAPTDVDSFVNCALDLLQVGQLEICKEWQTMKDHVLFAPTQLEVGRITCGAMLISEAVILQLGVQIKDHIRSNFLFKQFCNEISAFCSKFNDILSYSNETKCGKEALSNEIYIYHNMQQVELQKAFEIVTKQANASIERAMKAGDMLVEFFDGDSQLNKYIEVVKTVVCGMVQSACYLERYYKNLKIDCYVNA